MDNEDEVEGLGVGHAIEDEHGLHGEVPGAGTVWRGHDDGYGADNERDQRTTQSEVAGEVETEEGQVVMQEVANPYTKGEEQEQGNVAHIFQRDDALPDAFQRRAYLIIYRELSQQEMQQNENSNKTKAHHHIASPRETMQNAVKAGARLLEERAEGAHLEQYDEQRDAHDEQ